MNAPERLVVILLSLMVLGFGIFALNQYLNHLNEPAIAVSMLVIASAIAVLQWAVTPLPSARRGTR